MRLAVFTSKYPARVATFFERDMRALIAAGVEVDVFAIYPLDGSLWRYSLDILDDVVLPRNRVHHLGGLEAVRRSLPVPRRRIGTFLRDAIAISSSAARYGVLPLAKSAYVLPKALAWSNQRSGPYDHILAYWGNYAASCAYVFHRLTGATVPFSMWLHAGTDLYRDPVFLRTKLLHADSIITCCDFNRRYIEERFGEQVPGVGRKTLVCYHGLDLSTFQYAPDGRPARRIVAVGSLARYKGFDYLLRAVRELRSRGLDVEVELVGDGDQADALRALAGELGIGDLVRFRGWLPFHEVRIAMQAATLMVHPSPGLGDGLPNVIREAMAVGTPVIASRVAGIPEALDEGRCGELVPPKDVVALADAIERLLRDPELRRRYARLGRQRTEELFDLWQNGARLASHLRSVGRGKGRGRGAPSLPDLSVATGESARC